MEKHITIVGVLYISLGALGLLLAAVLFAIIAGAGVLSQDATAMWITGTIGSVIAGFITVISIPSLICGAAVLKRAPWARIFAMILGVIHLINVPVGTVIGGYALWVMLQPETAAMFDRNKSVEIY